MIDYEGIRLIVVKGLKEYLGIPVIRSHQNEPLEDENKNPIDTYISYTVTTLMSENKGTFGEYKDGTKRKPRTQTWSITSVSTDNVKSVTNACKAHDWLESVGKTYLSDNNVIVQSVGSVTNRDNFLTVGYEYKNGFDCFFWLMDEIKDTAENDGYIETAEISGINIKKPPTVEELNNELEKRLDGEVG